jgi:flagellar motor switch protein FliN
MSSENDSLMLSADAQQQLIDMISESMTAAGSSLGLLLGSEVTLSDPVLDCFETLAGFEEPFPDMAKTLACIPFGKGIEDTVFLILKNADCRMLSTMMMGSAEETDSDDLTELESGATAELLSQIYNSATGSLASLIGTAVSVGNPEVVPYNLEALEALQPKLTTEPFTVFRYAFSSTGEQPPIELVEIRLNAALKNILSAMGESTIPESVVEMPDLVEAVAEDKGQISLSDIIDVDSLMSAIAEPVACAVGASGASRQQAVVEPVMVRPVEFSSFDNASSAVGEENRNLALVMDVSLGLTVELGKTTLPIKEILELTRGSVIELQRVAGEAVDLMANGKLIAKGEVVVIEDNFGLRITSIISPEDRLRGL